MNTEATSYPTNWRQCPICGEWYNTIYSSSDPNYKVHTCHSETKEVSEDTCEFCHKDRGQLFQICLKCFRDLESKIPHSTTNKNIECQKCGKNLSACMYGNPDCDVKRHWHCLGHGGNVGLGLVDPCWRLDITTAEVDKNIEGWEAEFDENGRFNFLRWANLNKTGIESLKDFIRNLLQAQRESFKKGIEVNKEWSMIRTEDLAKLSAQREELEHKIRTMFTKEEVEGMKAGWVKEIEGLDENKAFEASGAVDYDFLDGFSEAKKAVITLINSLK
jgi:hypothetical protein